LSNIGISPEKRNEKSFQNEIKDIQQEFQYTRNKAISPLVLTPFETARENNAPRGMDTGQPSTNRNSKILGL
jgi:hypothetical protein